MRRGAAVRRSGCGLREHSMWKRSQRLTWWVAARARGRARGNLPQVFGRRETTGTADQEHGRDVDVSTAGSLPTGALDAMLRGFWDER